MIGYVEFSDGTSREYNAFSAGIADAQRDPDAVFYVTGVVNGTAHCKGVTTLFYGGSNNNLYGGNVSGTIASADVTLLGGSFAGNIVGGGSGFGAVVTDDVFLSIGGNAVIGTESDNRHVSGVGNGHVQGDVNLVMTGGTVYGHAYGCGSSTSGVVEGLTVVTMRAGKVTGNLYGVGAGTANDGVNVSIFGEIDGSVFGVGITSASAKGSVNLSIAGGRVGVSVYGVGQGSATGPVDISISGGEVMQHVFGIGTGSLTGTLNIDISGGLICGNVYAIGSANYIGSPVIRISGGLIQGDVFGGGENVTSGGTSFVSISGGAFSGTSRVFGGGVASRPDAYRQSAQVTMDSGASMLHQLAGGLCVNGTGGYTFDGDTSVILNAGTVSYGVAGRCVVYEGTLNDGAAGGVNASTVSVTGGYSRIVAGAGMINSPDASYSYTGNTEIVITGGTVDYVFGGNAAQKKAYCGNTAFYGDTSIHVDTSDYEASLKFVFGGSNSNSGSQAIQEGNTTVAFSGYGAQLHWAAGGGLSGDGAAKYSDIDKTRFTRSLVFDAFSGDFDAPAIARFDSVSFLNDSDVVFTSSALKLNEVSAWEFSLGTSLDWSTGTNSFVGDALVFGKAGDSLAVNVVWDVVSSDSNNIFNGWGRLGSIEVFGDALDTYDADTLTWYSASSNWLAGWDDTRNCIYVALA